MNSSLRSLRHVKSGRHYSKRVTRRIIWIPLGFLVLLFSWAGISGFITVSKLREAQIAATSVQEALLSKNEQQLTESVKRFSDAAQTAHYFSRDILWSSAGYLPYVGNYIQAVSNSATSADIIATETLPSLLSLAQQLNGNLLKPIDGRFQLDPIIAAQSEASTASESMSRADILMNKVSSSDLIEPFKGIYSATQEKVHQLSGYSESVNSIVQVLPQLLGATQLEHFIVIVQNLAEARSTGGIPGSLLLLEAENGEVRVLQNASTRDFPVFDPPVVDLPAGTRSLFGNQPAEMIQDSNYTPDFTQTGTIVHQMWLDQFGDDVDAVISVDPVVLGMVLRATGPITLESGDLLTSENVTQTLLSDAYSSYPLPDQQDGFFAGVANSVFGRLLTGEFDGPQLVGSLVEAGQEHRIFIWLKDPSLQKYLDGTTVGALLPTSRFDKPGFGIYFNDQTGAKMDYYLTAKISPSVNYCRKDGLPTYVFDIDLTNSAPLDAQTALPKYVTGGGAYGTQAGTIRTQFLSYAPLGGSWETISINHASAKNFVAETDGFLANVGEVYIPPGETVQIKLTYIAQKKWGTGIELITTPLLSSTTNEVVMTSCGSRVH